MFASDDPGVRALLGTGAVVVVQLCLALLVAVPYLLPARTVVSTRKRLLVGLLPPVLLGLAPAVLLVSLRLIRGPTFVFPAYGFLVVGLVAGLMLPLLVPGLRRRAWIGVPVLLAFGYWTLFPFAAFGTGMPVGADTPLRFLARLFA